MKSVHEWMLRGLIKPVSLVAPAASAQAGLWTDGASGSAWLDGVQRMATGLTGAVGKWLTATPWLPDVSERQGVQVHWQMQRGATVPLPELVSARAGAAYGVRASDADGAGGLQLQVLRGTLWVTSLGDPRDWIFEAGQTVALPPHHSDTLATALTEVELAWLPASTDA